ncbi:MAG TPA: hypothetical protein VIF57_18060 [Polyangia bacterium]|jgi:hypothetical protein
MTWKTGTNWVVAAFAQQCVLTALSVAVQPALASTASLAAVAGLVCAAGAWHRQFWGFAGVIAMCGVAILLDVYVLLFEPAANGLLLLHTFLYATIAGALYSARRQFARRTRAAG